MSFEVQNKRERRERLEMAFAAAVGACFAALPSAEADIIYSGDFGVTNVPINFANTVGVAFDINGMATAATTSFPGADINLFNSSTFGSTNLSFLGVGGPAGEALLSGTGVARLASGALVSAGAGVFSAGSAQLANHNTASAGNGNWAAGGTGFIGVRFDIGGNTHYGWMRLDVNPADYSASVVDFAYEDIADQPIRTGAIPEPTTIGLLALGAAGVAAVRRRRKAGQAEA